MTEKTVEIKESRLEELIEKKVKERLSNKKKNQETNNKDNSDKISRRSFLKKLGAGAAGLGALSLLPSVSAFDVKSSDGLEVYDNTDTNLLDVNPGGPVEILNTTLDIENDLQTTEGTTIWDSSNNQVPSGQLPQIETLSTGSTTAGEVPAAQGDGTLAMGSVDAGVPSGVITMWSGTVSDIPSGWTLCDGNNGTPDLTDRFVVGAGGSYTAGDTGGQDSVTLTVDEIPSHDHGSAGAHTHSIEVDYYNNANSGSGIGAGAGGDNHYPTTQSDGSHTHASVGGDSAHENRPPYYALAYIMKE